MPTVLLVALTGGPCAGKTSAVEPLAQHLRSRGWMVMTCPEAASHALRGVPPPPALGPEGREALQTAITLTTLAVEESRLAIARASGLPSAIVCDRGLPDGAAYCPPDAWERIAGAAGIGPDPAARYHAVIHLAPADAYSRDNNPSRFEEGPEAAAATDRAIRAAWASLPRERWREVPAQPSFDEKLRATLAAADALIGVP